MWLLLVLALAKAPKPPSAEVLIQHAETAINSGTFDVARDLGPLLERLRTTRDPDEQDDLIDAIEELGEYDGHSPASVKAYLRENAPDALFVVARSQTEWLVRCDALMVLRDLNVSDEVLDEAVAIANSATGENTKAIKFRGELLANWKESRGRSGNYPAPPPASTDKEQAALALLRKRGTRVSAYSLGDAVSPGDTELAGALIDAGIDVNGPIAASQTPLDYAVGIGCIEDRNVATRIATINLLLEKGADAKQKDGNDNTILMRAIDCSVPVIERLIDAGVDVNAMNAMKFSALSLAFAKGRWDAAELLVARGARLSKKAIDDLFFEKPTDPDKVALLKRATAK